VSNHCIECQECCKAVLVPVAKDVGVSFMNFLITMGMVITGSPELSVVVNVVCQHLGVDGCKIYNERPVECRAYECGEYDEKSDI